MPNPIRFCLALHDHQPIGNFDGVFEAAYQDSYKPLEDVLDRYPDLKLSLHISGSLFEWLEQHHPEYLDRLAGKVAAGRLEIIGGAYYEPILPMLPKRDRIGQIQAYSRKLASRLGASVRGLWIPERVWEANLVADLAESDIEYTILDDFHFRNAGLADDQLHGYYVSEDEGQLLKVFPGSERLRYLIPFGAPEETINYLRGIAERFPNAVVVFGDDGEKFGTWPETHQHVYKNGWLVRFLDALRANASWLKTCTLSEAVDQTSPLGKIYLPNASYREMTEWSLPVERINEYDDLVHDLEHDARWPRLKQFMRGGFWRNFKVKYPESDEAYNRMLLVSKRLAELQESHGPSERLEYARTELYRGQCNCSYWHGAFGGIYLPHLRHAVYNHLIAADNLLDKVARGDDPWVIASYDDYNLDARQEVLLTNDKLFALLAPSRGGQLYELDVRSICLNLGATLNRRPEAYHRKVLAGANNNGQNVASIHDRVVFKQEGLDRKLQYDWYPRKSLLDHFYAIETKLDDVVNCKAREGGDFLLGVYEAKLRRSASRCQVIMARNGNAWGTPLTLTKSINLAAGSGMFDVTYTIDGLPAGQTYLFGVEWNFAGLPDGADDRYFLDRDGNKLGRLGTQLNLSDTTAVSVVDEWQGIRVELGLSRPSHIWTFPIATVSQSEGGFELVHQSVVVHPYWYVQADADGRWTVTMQLACDTSLAERHMQEHAVAAGR